MFIIGFSDFFSIHKSVSGAVYKYFPSATIEMAGYLCMTLIASFLLRKLEKRLDGKSDYELVTADQLTMTAGTYNYQIDEDEQNRDLQAIQREEETKDAGE